MVITIDNNIEYISIIIRIESNYIETAYIRKYNPEWVIYDTEKGHISENIILNGLSMTPKKVIDVTRHNT